MQAAPMGAVAGLDAARWQYVFAHWQPSGDDELSAAVPAYAALAGAFIGAFPTVSVNQRSLTTTKEHWLCNCVRAPSGTYHHWWCCYPAAIGLGYRVAGKVLCNCGHTQSLQLLCSPVAVHG